MFVMFIFLLGVGFLCIIGLCFLEAIINETTKELNKKNKDDKAQ